MILNKKHQVVLKINGGLGNQMFQYAFGSVIAKRNKTKLSLDKTFFSKEHQQNYHAIRSFDLDIFNLDYNVYEAKKLNFIANKIKVLLTKVGVVGYKKYKELSFEFFKDSLEIKKPVYICGYFQSFKYFENYENYLNKIFSFPITKLDDKNTKYLQIIKSTNSISVHIRRGDYVTNSSANVVHGLCDLDYYIVSIETILKNKTTDDLTFFFFSDEIEWVKSKFDYLGHKKMLLNAAFFYEYLINDIAYLSPTYNDRTPSKSATKSG